MWRAVADHVGAAAGLHPVVQHRAAVELLQRGDLGVQAGVVLRKLLDRGDGAHPIRRIGQGQVGLEAGGHGAGGPPALDQGVQVGQLLGSGGVGCKLGELGLQRLRLRIAQAHGRAQVAHQATALHLGQVQGLGGNSRIVGELAVEVVVAQQEAACELGCACSTAGPAYFGEAACKGLGVAGGGSGDRVQQAGIAGGGVEVDALDAELGECEEFTGFADAVLVEVFPEFDAGKGDVVTVELAVGNA